MTDDITIALNASHRTELTAGSAIDPAVIAERGYVTVERPRAAMLDGHGRDTRQQLAAMGFPSWATREDYYYPGLLIPQYTASGTRYPGQFKPFRAVPNREGKLQRYASARGPARIDVHPRWSVLDPAVLPAILDPDRRLWITEGVKKADALTSRGEVTVALAGVYSWRNTHASLGDWEDVRLKGREVVICFDADAITKSHVAQAMARLGKWLKYKGATRVWYLVVPPGVNGKATKGVDDFFAAGGTLKELEQAFEKHPPEVTSLEDRFTDARLAETLAAEVLDGQYVWVPGLRWLHWDGRLWSEVDEVAVLETVRRWALDRHGEAAARLKLDDKAAGADVDGWRTMLSAAKANTVLTYARGIVSMPAGRFDADPDIVNTPTGVVHLPTLTVTPHDPDAYCTKITSGGYVPGFTHKDWNRALDALPKEVMDWFQVRIGQAITGHTTADGVVPILKGGGENAKGLLTTDGLVPALGGYAAAASPKLFASSKNEHSTERADLRGQRLVVAEELTEGESIDVTALKQIADVGRIKARKTHKDNIEFTTSHSLFATTNYTPVVSKTDHGTWRRLALVVFPYTYVKPGEPLQGPDDRRGDPTLKARIMANRDHQHDAAVTWAIEGAHRWYTNVAAIEAAGEAGEELPASVLLPPDRVRADTLAWRTEADRILGYWRARLVAEPGAYVMTSELTADFNAWLVENGHAPWSKETFGPRFRDHQETKRARVTAVRRRAAKVGAQVVRRPADWVSPAPLPAQIDLYEGLRWRKDGEGT